MNRAIILVLDSLGIGSSLDADRFGDTGADTLGHIAEQCAAGLDPMPRESSTRMMARFMNHLSSQ